MSEFVCERCGHVQPAKHSRADTEFHNTGELVFALEAARAKTKKRNPEQLLQEARELDAEVRDTLVPKP